MPNPLNLTLAQGVNSKIEKIPTEIVEIDRLEEMSLAEVHKAKRELSERKKRLQLQVDRSKLNQTSKIVDRMDMILDRMAEGYSAENVSAMDLKCLAAAYSDMLKNLNMISRLDSIDGGGKATKVSIEVKYKEE